MTESARYYYGTAAIVVIAIIIALVALWFANWIVAAVAALTALFMSGAASDFRGDVQRERQRHRWFTPPSSVDLCVICRLPRLQIQLEPCRGWGDCETGCGCRWDPSSASYVGVRRKS